MRILVGLCAFAGAVEENHFKHLDGILHPDKYEILKGLTDDDKLHIMGDLVTKMDVDGDSEIEPSELATWIHYVEQTRLHKEVYEQFPQFDTDRDEFISMEEYNHRTYDFIHDPEYADKLTKEDIDHVEAANKRDIRRFLESDRNQDGQLDIEEFSAFLHPHAHEHMQEVLLMETFEDMDVAHDGRITFDEYMSHITGYADEKHNDEEWLEKEKEHFEQTLDLDGDGSLNKTEVEKWIRPEGSNPIEFEVQHMVQRIDMNTDGKLSRAEILENYPELLNSQATDWGKAFLYHDEL